MASRASVATLAIFASRGGCKNACWGASPNPALWDKLSQSLLSASPSLIAPVPYFCARPTGRADDRYLPLPERAIQQYEAH